jgi:hypothetical protein
VLGAVALVALAAAGAIAWQVGWDSETRFLGSRAPAEWLTEAVLPSSRILPVEEREVVFSKRFELAVPPARATLRARLHRAGAVLLNGRETGLAVAPGEPWKRVREVEVGALLVAGANEITVRARASAGPPAVWVSLEAPGLEIASDASWRAALARDPPYPARLARVPMSAWVETESVPHGRVLRLALPWLAGFALLAGVALFALRRAPEPRAWLVAASALALALLAWHNRALHPEIGFDADSHLEYVRFILREHRLPLASDGWSMYHPPLYYLAAAAIYAASDGSAAWLRGLNALAGVVQCAALLGSLRVLFPGQPRRVFAGFALGASVPMQLYLAQYVTNEVWTAAFASSALYLGLRILARDERSAFAHLALGALLGAALLTKVSALLVAGVVIAALGARLAARGERSPRAWLASVGAVALGVLVVAGWSYARVAWHFGTPLVGNWDEAAGLSWWQYPGYRTALDYVRFGDSLTHPVYSAWNGCPDALYSTLWGDGLLGGMASLDYAPPWRYELMLAGYWLALLPSAGVAIGVCAALARLVRQPSAEWALLLGVAFATAFALISLSLRLPFYGQCKAFYGLSALVPFSAFGALGLDLAAARLGRARAALWVLLGTWALCAWATYWSR